MASPKKRGLGRGLSALISTPESAPQAHPEAAEATAARERLVHLDPREVRPNPKQPRVQFSEEALEELAASIRQDGVQEPVIVRQAGGGYELVSGERRVRASVMADLETIPAIVRDVSDRDMLKLGLIENLQREDLNPIELATAYQGLIDEFHWTQEELGQQVGKRRSTVTNTLRLLELGPIAQDALAAGDITMGHAKALLAIEAPVEQAKLCRKIVKEGLSVRQAEKLASPKPPDSGKKPAAKDPNLVSLEDDLRRSLGTKVAIKPASGGRGKIEIDYFNLDELERILSRLRSRG